MRPTRILMAICLAVIMTAGSTVFAFERKAPSGALRPGGTVRPTVKELTTNECVGLGGDVIDSGPSCKTGTACKIKTKNRGVRYLCITELN
jgi:hypothetical protein